MNKFDLISQVKKIISSKDPNQIKSISCNFDILDENDREFNYHNLIKYWKKETKEEDEVVKEYINIKMMNSNKDISLKATVGIFSLFYFKNRNNFLAVGKHQEDMFHFRVKCEQYQKVLSNAINYENELFVLTYWLI